MDDACSSDQVAAERWPHVINLELGGNYARPKNAATGKGKGVIRGIADHAAVNEAVLLFQALDNLYRDLGVPVGEMSKLGPYQGAEWLGR
jgi:hypothetical protein